MIPQEKIAEVAAEIHYTETALRRAITVGRYSDKMARSLEGALKLEHGSLPRSEQIGVPRIARVHMPEFRRKILQLREDRGLEWVARALEVHYESARAICVGKVAPSILQIRSLMKNVGPSWTKFDDPTFESPDARDPLGVGKMIRDRRIQMCLTLEELAAMVGVSKGSMSRYETRGIAPPDRLLVIAEVLGHTTLRDLLNARAALSPAPVAQAAT